MEFHCLNHSHPSAVRFEPGYVYRIGPTSSLELASYSVTNKNVNKLFHLESVMSAMDHMVRFPRPSPSIFAHYKRGVEGLGMRLACKCLCTWSGFTRLELSVNMISTMAAKKCSLELSAPA